MAGQGTREAPVRTEPHHPARRAFPSAAFGEHADTPIRFSPRLQAKVCQAGMIQWARERSVPMKFAFGFFDRQIVNGGVPMMH